MHLLKLKSQNVSCFDEWQIQIIDGLRALTRELELSVDDTANYTQSFDKVIVVSYLRVVSIAIDAISTAINAACMSRYTAVISNLYEIDKKVDAVVAKGGPKRISEFASKLLQTLSCS